MPSELSTSLPSARISESSLPSAGVELRLVARALFSRWKSILTVTMVSILLCMSYLWSADMLYSSTAEILIDPRPKQLLEKDVAPTGLGSSALGPDTLLLDSQIEVIRSSSVLDKVVAKHKLVSDPLYGETKPSAVMDAIGPVAKWIVRGPQASSLPDETPFDRASRRLRSGLRVERKSNTYVVSITVRSLDRFQAADIANSISSIFVNESNAAFNVVAQEAATSLTQPLVKLRQEAEDAERKVEEYRKQNGLSGSPDNLVIEQQLRELNTLFSAARAATREEEALWQEVKAVSPGNLRQLTGVSKLQSPLLTESILQLSAATSAEEGLAVRYFAKHPLVKAAALRRKSVEQVIINEVQGIVLRQKVKYDAALRKERDIEAKVLELETQSMQLRSASIKLNELAADAAMRREMLGTFMNRAKLADEQVGMPASTIRIISQATAASRPVSPPALLLLAFSGSGGFALGILLAWLAHLISGTRPRARPQPE